MLHSFALHGGTIFCLTNPLSLDSYISYCRSYFQLLVGSNMRLCREIFFENHLAVFLNVGIAGENVVHISNINYQTALWKLY